MSLSRKILLGLGLGVLLGLFLGEHAAFLQVAADGYVKLLQMTVLPYVVVSIVSGLGSLSYAEARTLGVKAGFVLLLLWGVALIMVFMFPLMFPASETASFFSTTLLEPRERFDPVDLYIPSNPFNSLANNVVPAVVLFSVVLGVALIGISGKTRLLEVLAVVGEAVSRATSYVVRLTPYGIFAIAATATGTLSIEQIDRLQVYFVSYVALSLLISLWILPGLVAALTPIPYRTVLGATRDALITAFVTGNLFIVLPILSERTKALAREHGLSEEHSDSPDVIVPTSFNFPHTGKLLTLSFILFAGWFSDAAVTATQYPQLALTGLVTLFGNINVAVPFLLDLFRIPADTFQLFLATSVVNARFGTLMAAVHTTTMALLGTWAIAGALRVERRRLVRYAVFSLLLTVVTVGGVRAMLSGLVQGGYEGDRIIAGMRLLHEPAPVTVHRTAVSPPNEVASDRPALERIRARGALRAGYLADSLPFAYFNASGDLVGFDVEMAHQLARELGVRLELVPVERRSLAGALTECGCDLVMSGVGVTTERAADTLLSAAYLDETLAIVVPDHRRDRFASWDLIRRQGRLRLGVPNLPYYVRKVEEELPQAETTRFDSAEAIFGPEGQALDAHVLTAERGSAWTLLHPELAVVVPTPGLIKVPLAYPIAGRDTGFATFINTWIDLKRKDGTIQSLYDHWILGRDAVPPHPRWSILRNVLHWVD
jgi:Na+/H+-dicarboxylate symporter/ABC-type amino acid transport substrate-binding protein